MIFIIDSEDFILLYFFYVSKVKIRQFDSFSRGNILFTSEEDDTDDSEEDDELIRLSAKCLKQ